MYEERESVMSKEQTCVWEQNIFYFMRDQTTTCQSTEPTLMHVDRWNIFIESRQTFKRLKEIVIKATTPVNPIGEQLSI